MLKSKYQGRVEKAIEYAKTIESWDDIVDPQTLAFYCLGPDPSSYMLRLIDIEGKKSKFRFVNVALFSFCVYLYNC